MLNNVVNEGSIACCNLWLQGFGLLVGLQGPRDSHVKQRTAWKRGARVSLVEQALVQVAELTVAAFDFPLQARGGDIDDVEDELRVALAEHVAGKCQRHHSRQHGRVDFDGSRIDTGAE